jgi:hypothetical protein
MRPFGTTNLADNCPQKRRHPTPAWPGFEDEDDDEDENEAPSEGLSLPAPLFSHHTLEKGV